ncbi:hypothetical protein IGI04_024716, partial [Brassica rapa subsp. trilocularis]
ISGENFMASARGLVKSSMSRIYLLVRRHPKILSWPVKRGGAILPSTGDWIEICPGLRLGIPFMLTDVRVQFLVRTVLSSLWLWTEARVDK